MFKTKIGVSHSFKGTHNWPEAEQFAGSDVKFLENEHRHTFHIKVEIEVFHDDRCVEFFVLQNKVKDICNQLYRTDGLAYRLGRKSCEQIGKEILIKLQQQYPWCRELSAYISEDNEVWAQVDWSVELFDLAGK